MLNFVEPDYLHVYRRRIKFLADVFYIMVVDVIQCYDNHAPHLLGPILVVVVGFTTTYAISTFHH